MYHIYVICRIYVILYRIWGNFLLSAWQRNFLVANILHFSVNELLSPFFFKYGKYIGYLWRNYYGLKPWEIDWILINYSLVQVSIKTFVFYIQMNQSFFTNRVSIANQIKNCQFWLTKNSILQLPLLPFRPFAVLKTSPIVYSFMQSTFG